MTSYHVSDDVICKIRDSHIVLADTPDYDETKKFQIISVFEGGYFIYVPSLMSLKDSVKLDYYNIKDYEISDRYIGSTVYFLTHRHIVRLYSRNVGMACNRCKEFAMMAEPNQPDDTFICYLCRFNPYR